jgi:cardiolipin synthase
VGTQSLQRICLYLLAVVLLTGCASERPIAYRIKSDFSVKDPQFARSMGSLLGTPLVPGNSVTTLLNGDEISPELLKAVRGAKKSINFETYIYWSGKIGEEMCDALAERAQAGVAVHVLIDWYGSERIDEKYVKRMKAAGCSVQKYHPFHFWLPTTWLDLDHRTHRKLLIVDGTVGFTGGVGIADVWSGDAQNKDHWRDTHFRVDGPVVSQLQSVFMDNWIQTTGEVLQGDAYFPVIPKAGDQWAQVFASSFDGGSENMQLLFLLSVAAAEKNICIESAYFVPDQLTIDTLVAARKRGVNVSIIVPGQHIDEKEVRAASRARWGELLQAGVEIYEFEPTMIHCKEIIVDGLWVSIGSANMDNRSFRLNDEANLNVLDKDFAESQLKIFEADKGRAKRITYEQWHERPFWEKFHEQFFSSFGSEM